MSAVVLHSPSATPAPRRGRLRSVLAAGGVVLAHAGLFTLLGQVGETPAPQIEAPAIEVALIPPSPPITPPPPPNPTPVSGGGAPAAPSRVHTPPPTPVPPEIPAPRTPAPEPALVIGASDAASEQPGLGQGGEGSGSGEGVGPGDGPGEGFSGPRFLRGPSNAELARLHPSQARGGLFGGRVGGEGVIHCRIGLDQRLERCRIVSETPEGRGFGVAALQAAGFYRFDPPRRGGRALPDEGLTLTVSFR